MLTLQFKAFGLPQPRGTHLVIHLARAKRSAILRTSLVSHPWFKRRQLFHVATEHRVLPLARTKRVASQATFKSRAPIPGFVLYLYPIDIASHYNVVDKDLISSFLHQTKFG